MQNTDASTNRQTWTQRKCLTILSSAKLKRMLSNKDVYDNAYSMAFELIESVALESGKDSAVYTYYMQLTELSLELMVADVLKHARATAKKPCKCIHCNA